MIELKELLNTKITDKKTIKQKLIEYLLISIIITLIIWLSFGPNINVLIAAANAIKEGKFSALRFSLLMFPIVFIFVTFISLGWIFLTSGTKTKKKK